MEPVDPGLAPFAIDDAIFDPDVQQQLSKYFDSGCDQYLATSMLSNSYSGYDDAISVLYEWAQLSDSGEKLLHGAIQENFDLNQTALLSCINTNLAKDPDSADIIKRVCALPHWPTFMNELANKHKQTAFYDIVKREAKLPEIGISSDVLRTPEAFISEIIDQFEKLSTTNSPVPNSQLVDFLNKMSVMCTYDELTTVVSLRLFAELARKANHSHMRALYRKVAEEVRKEAVKVMSTSSIVPKHIARQYVIRLAINVDSAMSGVQIPKSVIDALVTIADNSHRRRFDKEVAVLMRQYSHLLGAMDITDSGLVIAEDPASSPKPDEKKVLIQALCHPEVLLDLLKALYSHSCRTYVDGRPDPGKRQCVSMLLSYVSVFISMNDREIEEHLNSNKTKQLLQKSVKEMYDKLNCTAQVCEELIPGSSHSKIKGKSVETLLKGAKDPLISRGIVMWVKECLQGGTDLRSLLTTAPKHLGFLEAVAKHHDILCEDILLVIHTAFTRDYPGLDTTQVNQLRDMFMKTIAGMLKYTMGPQVVLIFQQWWVDGGVAKKPHLRNFVGALFQTVSPPYSTSFAIAINEILGHETVLSAIEGDAGLSGKVFNFRDQTAEVLSKQNGIAASGNESAIREGSH